jgi:large subunit ribosomal protein L25
MAQTELNVTPRSRIGKGGARNLRRQGLVPGTVYGKGMESCAVTVEPKSLLRVIATEAGWNTLITLKGDGVFDNKVVILKDMQVEPIRRDVLHADFQAIDLKTKVNVMVPVNPVGKAEGEKVGGSLQVVRKELEVVCLPTVIPGAIDVDVTAMVIGDVLHVEDLALPEGVEAPHEANFTVITVTGRKEEEEEIAAVEVETEAEA